MTLEMGQHYAAQITKWLSPFCERIEVAGSIRRLRPVVNDVDLVCIPKVRRHADLFENFIALENKLRNFLIGYVRETPGASWSSGKEPEKEAKNLLLQLPKCQLDLWMADEKTLATRLLCRTGSKEHNVWIAQRAKDFGGHWFPYDGLVIGSHRVQADSEDAIYKALGLEFIPPEEREAGRLERFVIRRSRNTEIDQSLVTTWNVASGSTATEGRF